MRKIFVVSSILTLLLQSWASYLDQKFLWTFLLTVPIILLGIYEMIQTHHTIMRNYPIVGRLRYVMEQLRPKIYQYFIESDTDGTPINRITRSLIYQRAKKDVSTTPFGTQLNVYENGYEWINHSLSALKAEDILPENCRVIVGGKDCKQPYSLSIFNIAAMSFGALSPTAIKSLNWGAKVGGFAHNTGEGGLSPYHLEHGGDIIWQIGTGLFSCRTPEGHFCEIEFTKKAILPQVKMIEIKLSQGAKPGHGGILPAAKNTEEIAKIRGVKPHTKVESPPRHNSFNSPREMMAFIQKLRNLSGGKPIGFKLCYGIPSEFEALCEAMVATNILPDYITVDGGEGGTGAAPLEFSNSVGTPLREGLVSVYNTLTKYGLKKEIKIIASGKILNGFDLVKTIALGADACNSARGMMLSLGCIQALECNKNSCPTGVATQNPSLYNGLVVKDKFQRVANFQGETVHSATEILAASGLSAFNQLKREHIWRRIGAVEVKNYEQLYPYETTQNSIVNQKRSLKYNAS